MNNKTKKTISWMITFCITLFLILGVAWLNIKYGTIGFRVFVMAMLISLWVELVLKK